MESEDKSLSPGFVQNAVGAYSEGVPDRNDLLRLLAFIAHTIDTTPEKAWPIQHAALAYISIAFKRIAAGTEPPDRALGIANKRGRPNSESTKQKHIFMAMDVIVLMDSGKPLLDAALEVSEKYHISAGKVQDAYCKFKDYATAVLIIKTDLDRVQAEQDGQRHEDSTQR